MPELPEVNTIKDQLNEVTPFKIKSCTLSSVAGSIVHTEMKQLRGKTFKTVERKGKMLNFILSDGRHLLSHLGMSGGWRISDTKVLEKHTHVQFKGECNGEEKFIAYVDPRRFGHMYLYDKERAKQKLNELGADLKSKDFTLSYFQTSLKKYPERFLKVTLLDQSLFAGTGNYIASEICARAFVRPDRKVKSLNEKEIILLYKAIFKVIDGATETGGTTFAGGYADTTGSKGGGVQHLVVFYQKICQQCKTSEVKKITLAQRGTYYCPDCQR
jgi:formamidopyrimidine-DNA glycosylase